ncbi:MAG: hypothetical protein WC919_06975 [Candidatus Paceibacterota bacterium]|jgi:hypothetical protein
MIAAEFKTACKLAFDRAVDLSGENDDSFWGFGLPGFKPIMATIRQAAKAIRYQCWQFDGGIDQDNLQECRVAFRKSITVIG